jgi:hypothetical protein
MSVDFERELRAEMEQAPIRPRPDTVREAFRRSRRRRHAARAAVAAGTAIAAGIAAVILADSSGQDHIETTAYVVSQLNSALAAASSDIMYVHQSGVDPMGGKANAFDNRYWGYASQSRELTIFSGAEQDNWDTLTHVKRGILDTEISVTYRQRTAVKSTALFPAASKPSSMGCSGIPGGLPYGPGTGVVETAPWLAGYMHALLGCGGVKAAWDQRFDGTEAIELTGHFGATTWHVWIDEATFLPIADGFSSSVAADGSSSERYGWLPPTKANLANLTGPIPPGFTLTTQPPTVAIAPHLKPAGPPALPTVWGTGPAAAIARRMGAALNVTSQEILAERQVVTGSPSVARVVLTWIYPGKVRTQTFSGAGKLNYDSGITTTLAGHDGIKQVSTTVDYVHRQVLRDGGGGPAGVWNPGLPTPSQVCLKAAEGQDSVTDYSTGFSPQYGADDSAAVMVRDLLACPHISVTISSHQRFNGADAIKVTWPRPRQHSTDTFWLDASTYALIGLAWVTGPEDHEGAAGMPVASSSSVEERWLPPTKANLALFNLYVPPSFAGAS